MAIHSSTIVWKIPWTEEPGRLQSMGRKESDTTERLNWTELMVSKYIDQDDAVITAEAQQQSRTFEQLASSASKKTL